MTIFTVSDLALQLPTYIGKFSGNNIASVRRVGEADEHDASVPSLGYEPDESSLSVPLAAAHSRRPVDACRQWSALRAVASEPHSAMSLNGAAVVQVSGAVTNIERAQLECTVELDGVLRCSYWEMDSPLPPLDEGAQCTVYGIPRAGMGGGEPWFHAFLIRI